MIHVSTDNALDVVYDYEDGRQVLRGLQQHGSDEIIPLPEPRGLVRVLQTILAEIEKENNEPTKRTANL